MPQVECKAQFKHHCFELLICNKRFWEFFSVPAWLNEVLCSKIDLSYRQKYELRSKFVIFDIFLLNVHHTKHSHHKHFVQIKCERKKVLWNKLFLFSHRSMHKLQSLIAHISVKLFWMISYMATFRAFWFEYHCRLIIFGWKYEENCVYCNKVPSSIFILPQRASFSGAGYGSQICKCVTQLANDFNIIAFWSIQIISSSFKM